MDETVGVGVGPAERGHHAGGDGPTPEPRRRMSARRKQETVLRLLRGEDLELISRDLAVTAAELSGWRDQFLAAGEASLKSRPADARDAEIGRLQAKVGELTMTADSGGEDRALRTHRPSARRRSNNESAGLALHRPVYGLFGSHPLGCLTATLYRHVIARREAVRRPRRGAMRGAKAWWRQSDSCSRQPFSW